MTPAPSAVHQYVVLKIGVLFDRAGREGQGPAFVARADVMFGPHNDTRLNGCFVRADGAGIVSTHRIEGVPDSVVEVASPSSRRCDTRAKLRLHERCGVPIRGVIDPDERLVRSFELVDRRLVARPVLRTGDTLVR